MSQQRSPSKMNSGSVTIIFLVFVFSREFRVEAMGLVEMISDYARVSKNTERPTAEAAKNESALTSVQPETTTEFVPDYQDFDDLQEEEDRSLKNSQSETMMKYFNGLISLLALMYKFNGSLGGTKPSNRPQVKTPNEPREKTGKDGSLGKHFSEAQDRFEFPQKKFRYHENTKDNTIDQQFQPLENYPPYNPSKANAAETYHQEDKKTSYDSDIIQYDLTKNSIADFDPDVDIQQSYSYEIPYETPKPAKTPTYDLTNDAAMSWNNDVHPVYHSWMTHPDNKPPGDGAHQPWKSQPPQDDYKPWKPKTPDAKPPPPDPDPRQPWNDKPADFPIYHHDFKDPPPPNDHHFEYHDIDHPIDEDRVSKKPYSYYFLGRKLWYVPLLFSVYFVIYVGALVLKSVARHKIQFPEKIWNLHDEHFGHGKNRRHRKVDDVTENYEKAIQKMNNKFM